MPEPSDPITPGPESVAAPQTERRLTVPNALSVLRLAGVPVFFWLLLGPEEDLIALVVLVAGAITDWLDGKLARWLNQASKLGAMLDPVADRLYILAALLAFVLRDIIPWWAAVLLIVRDLLVAGALPLLRRAGYAPPEVTYVGKAATFSLLYAFPFLLLAQSEVGAAPWASPVGYAFLIWGSALYVWTGMLYLVQIGQAIRHPVSGPRPG